MRFSKLELHDGPKGRFSRCGGCGAELIRRLEHPRPKISGAFVRQAEKCRADSSAVQLSTAASFGQLHVGPKTACLQAGAISDGCSGRFTL
jgi:hypothetical protein